LATGYKAKGNRIAYAAFGQGTGTILAFDEPERQMMVRKRIYSIQRIVTSFGSKPDIDAVPLA